MISHLKQIGLCFLFSSLINNSFASDKPEYKTSLIPVNLQKNAKIVIRNSELKIDVDKDDAVEEHNMVISILNKNGTDYTIFHEMYDKFSSISGFHLTVYDGEGKKIKSYGASDLVNYSGFNGYSLYEDNRLELLDPLYKKYPCTVEISYKRKIKSLLLLPKWPVFPDYNCSIEKSSLFINVKPGVEIRFLERNMPTTVTTSDDKDGMHYIWQVQNLEAFSSEDFEQPFSEYTPEVILAPNNFQIDNTEGNFKSWKEFGKWYAGLKKDRDILLPETVKKLEQLTTGMDDYSKIRSIYQFMQKRTRYVSIQVGIGSWQPFEAKTVDRLGYGDCKALTNYTGALLKAVGIKSEHVLIMAGSNAPSSILEFPSNSFNHVILAVPIKSDTLYLECTSPYLPAGHIGDFTDNRNALMINDSGGVIIKTRTYKQPENIKSSNINVTLDIDGNSLAKISTIYKGLYFDDIKYLSIKTDEDIKKELYKRMEITNYSIVSFSYNRPDSLAPTIVENIDIDMQNYTTKMSNKVFLPLNLVNKITEIPDISESRKCKIVIKRYSTTIDSILYTLPDNYTVEKLPSEYNLPSQFGLYQSKCVENAGKILYVRKLALIPGTYETIEAPKFKEFYTKVSKADMMKLTLIKKP